jgi:hypothetical protein
VPADRPLPSWARRLTELRRARAWSAADLARELKKRRDGLPPVRSLAHMIQMDWETGRHRPGPLADRRRRLRSTRHTALPLLRVAEGVLAAVKPAADVVDQDADRASGQDLLLRLVGSELSTVWLPAQAYRLSPEPVSPVGSAEMNRHPTQPRECHRWCTGRS